MTIFTNQLPLRMFNGYFSDLYFGNTFLKFNLSTAMLSKFLSKNFLNFNTFWWQCIGICQVCDFVYSICKAYWRFLHLMYWYTFMHFLLLNVLWGVFYAHMLCSWMIDICLLIKFILLIKTSLFTFNLLHYFILYYFRVEERFILLKNILYYSHVTEFGLFCHLSLVGSINKRPRVLPLLPGYLMRFKSRFF